MKLSSAVCYFFGRQQELSVTISVVRSGGGGGELEYKKGGGARRLA